MIGIYNFSDCSLLGFFNYYFDNQYLHISGGFGLFEQARGYYLPTPLQPNLELIISLLSIITLAYFLSYLRAAKFEVNQP